MSVRRRAARARKALAAALVPLSTAIVGWAATGQLDHTSASLALAGALAGLVVYSVPNAR